jgi:parallel beta-helix repeat protein
MKREECMDIRTYVRGLQEFGKSRGSRRENKKLSTTKSSSRFLLEQLEARTLLSADLGAAIQIPVVPEAVQPTNQPVAIVQTQAVPTGSTGSQSSTGSFASQYGVLDPSTGSVGGDVPIPVGIMLTSPDIATALRLSQQPSTSRMQTTPIADPTLDINSSPGQPVSPVVESTDLIAQSPVESNSSLTTQDSSAAATETSVFQASLTSTQTGVTRYVSPVGSDANSGSLAQPYRTIQKAVATAQAGDTIYVTNGTYTEGPIVFRRSGEPGKPITLSAAPGHSPVIRWASNTVADNSIIISAPAGMHRGWIVIQGLELTNGFRGVRLHNAHDVVLRDNVIHGNYNNGIQGSGTRITVDGNTLYNNGRDGTHGYGLYTSGRSWTITNNVIYSNHRGGVQMASFSPTTVGYSSPDYAVSSGWTVANNIFAWNRNGFGLVIWGSGSANSRVEQNIFYENALTWPNYEPQGIWFMSPGAGHVLKSNVFYATAPGGTRPIGGTPGNWYTETGRIEANPLFVKAGATPIASPDFSLRTGSPAVF